jgi:hypothetical protein
MNGSAGLVWSCCWSLVLVLLLVLVLVPGPWLELWTFGPLDRLTFEPLDLDGWPRPDLDD